MAKRIIGITGGIGAGKSVVSRVLRGRGYVVFDCDFEAKRLMNFDQQLRDTLIGLFGKELYTEEGLLNRPYLASIIFNDEESRLVVNSHVHSAVRREFMVTADSVADTMFVEAAIMGSSGLAPLCSEVWIVTAPDDVRFERAMTRGGINEADLRSRMDAQKHETNLLRQSGVPLKTIDNSRTADVLREIDLALC